MSSSSTPYNPTAVPPTTVPCDENCPCEDGQPEATNTPGANISSHAHDFGGLQPGASGQDKGGGSGGQSRNLSAFPIRYFNGEVRLVSTDLKSFNFGEEWGQVRSWSNQLSVQDQGVNGNGWFVKMAPALSNPNSDPDHPNHASIALIGIVNDTLWFDYSPETPADYVPRWNIKSKLAYDETNLEFVHTDTQGRVTRFHDFTVAPELQGKFKNFKDRFGHERTATYNEGGRLLTIEQTDGGAGTCMYAYAYYLDGANTGQILSVTYAVDETPVRRCLYEYWEDGDAHGSLHDLKLATLQQYGASCPPPPSSSSGPAWLTLAQMCYRYYAADGETGFKHGIKYVFGPEAYARAVTAEHDPADDAVDDVDVAPFANHYFEYDAEKRVTKESVNGGELAYTYAYQGSGHSGGYNIWNMRTTETLPDGNQNIVYTNDVGQVMLKVFVKVVEEEPTEDRWYDYTLFDEKARIILRGSSSAVAAVSEAAEGLVTLHSATGLIYTAGYYPDNTTEPGEAPGYLQFEAVQQGESGTPATLRELEYTSREIIGDTIYPVAKVTVFRDEAGTQPISTEYDYAWFTDTFQVQDLTVTLPPVPEEQNGTDTPNTRVTRSNAYGQPLWAQDERGIITGYTWNVLTGGLLQRTDDADTDTPWEPTEGDHLNLVTDFKSDLLGRMTQELGPTHSVDLAGTSTTIRRARYLVYLDESLQQWSGVGYVTGSGPDYTYFTVGPVQLIYLDHMGRVTNVVASTRGLSDALNACDSFPQSDWCRFARYYFDDQNRLFKTQVYHDIPASGTGSLHTNYEETAYGYDAMMRRNRVQTSGGTITRTVYDARGLVASSWVGTNDTGATDSNPAGSGTPNNMVTVQEFEYDGGVAGLDGLLTEATAYADDSDTRVTAYIYDWRNRRTSVDGEVDFFQSFAYDNLNRVTIVEQRDTDGEGALAWSRETKFDDRGRVYQIVRQGADGDEGSSLTDNVWHDDSGNVARRLPAGSNAFEKFAYDNLGRVTAVYLAYGPGNLDDDTVMEQRETIYDHASNVIQQNLRRRFHDAAGTNALGDPTTAPEARVSYVALYPDPVGRVSRRADYGTNDGTALMRDDVAPAPSDTILVTRTEFNERGEPADVTDPMERVVQSTFDDAGRLTQRVENFVESGTDPDQNRTTEFAYNPDSRLSQLTAVNAITGNQETKYFYGTIIGSEDSDVASNDLLRTIRYPDYTSGTDEVTRGYNRLGQVKRRTDQAGTVHDYLYDKLGRLTDDKAAALGSGIDDAVRRISRTYEFRGLLETITSHDATSGGSVVNQVGFEYNDFGQLIEDKQAHGGVVGGSTPKCEYDYAEGTDNTLRPLSIKYPNGRELSYDYGEATEMNDQLSRIRAIMEGEDDVVAYQYLGLSEFVEAGYEEPGVKLTYLKQGGEGNGDGGDKYAGLDRFMRVVDQRWIKGEDDLERVKYGFDANSNRVWRRNTVAEALSAHQDELYANDGLNQLAKLQRGDVSGGVISNQTWQEQFTLDPTGNWDEYETTVDSDPPVNQTRTHNEANELKEIDSSSALVDEDAAGNMIKVPKPDDWESGYDLTYDAWNRLVKVEETIEEELTTVAEYAYDGLTRRVKKMLGDTTRHYYYSSQWQILEERVDNSTDPDRQFVWGLRYVDDLVLRDRDTETDPRLYTLHDYFHPTVLTDEDGEVMERLGYDAYGTSRLMNASFGTSSPTPPDYEWETRFGAYRWDGETELYQVRYRQFHPRMGRWITRDPLEAPVSVNFYAYVRNRAITLVDPLGLQEAGRTDPLLDPFGELDPAGNWDWIAPSDTFVQLNPVTVPDFNLPPSVCIFSGDPILFPPLESPPVQPGLPLTPPVITSPVSTSPGLTLIPPAQPITINPEYPLVIPPPELPPSILQPKPTENPFPFLPPNVTIIQTPQFPTPPYMKTYPVFGIGISIGAKPEPDYEKPPYGRMKEPKERVKWPWE